MQGNTVSIMKIPDGPGYPRVNGISPDGATFFFLDFQFFYTIDVASATVTSQHSFSGAPRSVGYPVWVPTGSKHVAA